MFPIVAFVIEVCKYTNTIIMMAQSIYANEYVLEHVCTKNAQLWGVFISIDNHLATLDVVSFRIFLHPHQGVVEELLKLARGGNIVARPHPFARTG